MVNNAYSGLGVREGKTEDHKFITVLMIFYILWRTPIVALYMNTYLAMLLLVTMVVAVALSVESFRIKASLAVSATLYLLLLAIELFVGDTPFFNVLWSVFLDATPILIGSLLVFNGMDSVIKRIVPLIIIVYGITAVTTYIGLLTYPDASRLLATTGDHYKTYFKYNIGGFDFIYSLTLLHPLIVCVLRAKNKIVLSVVFTVISALCIFKSAYTMAALLFIISCVAYILPIKSGQIKAKRRVRIIAVVLVIALFFTPIILEGLAQWGILEDSAGKISDISSLLQGETTSVEDTQLRQGAYVRSWDTFIDNPIMGAVLFGTGKNGGHSFVLDTMANWGIIGLAVLIVLFVSFYKTYRMIAKGTPVFYYSILFGLLTVVLCILNPNLWTFELGFAVPMLMYYATDSCNNLSEDSYGLT